MDVKGFYSVNWQIKGWCYYLDKEKESMEHMKFEPHIFHILSYEALEIHHSSFGSVGKIFSGEGIEAVRVKKEDEEIDPDWFSQPMMDLILVINPLT